MDFASTAQSYIAKLSETIRSIPGVFDKISDKVSDDSVDIPTKELRNSYETLETPSSKRTDGRSRIRTQKQIDAYKKNFAKRHREPRAPEQRPLKPAISIYDKIFSPPRV